MKPLLSLSLGLMLVAGCDHAPSTWESAYKELKASDDRLKASNDQLIASEGQLIEANRGLSESEVHTAVLCGMHTYQMSLNGNRFIPMADVESNAIEMYYRHFPK